jgi:hypothetical protein
LLAFLFHCGESSLRISSLTADFQLPMPFIGDAALDVQSATLLFVSPENLRNTFEL